MPRQSTSGTPYLFQRSENGIWSYRRTLKSTIASFVTGTVHVSWDVASPKLTGNAVVNLSLATRDIRLARERWAEIHPQIEKMAKAAAVAAKQANGTSNSATQGPSVRPLGGAQSLLSGDRAVISQQAYHDILAADDLAWADPDSLTNDLAQTDPLARPDPLARGLAAALHFRAQGHYPFILDRETTAEFGDFLDSSSFPPDMTNDEILEWSQRRRTKRLSEDLAAGRTDFVDPPPAVQEESVLDPSAPGSYRPKNRTVVHGELEQRLAENGLTAPDPVDRRLLARNMMSAKLKGHKDVDARKQGKPVETPPRPAPIVDPRTN